ncbi:NACHT, LRR and PYD domains-containing protein 6-like [Puntigrus tetrazona]|uniref:NACHT, LRR and PYD domains-containing protein 6-like n=1 Tax=Puntigrus tetrazona TaxID=1606681 RepID=UPI001C8A49BA|nr:NACHT, LRR and PYD domains-containing protein 6-like [Puntigrus tetrazona]
MAFVKELLVGSLKGLVEAELKEFHWRLMNTYHKHITKSELEKADIFDTVDKMVVCFGPEEAVEVMVDILRKMNQNDLAEQLVKEHTQAQTEGNMNISAAVGEQQNCFETHKTNMKKKVEYIFEGSRENEAQLKAVYTDLFITEGDMEDVNHEHEILKIDNALKHRKTQEKPVKCNDIFTELRKNNEKKHSAANLIPPQYVGLFTEVRGFTDQQKEQYFTKRMKDQSLSSRIISHIKTSRSLYIMCHIPVFCWITATVLQDILTENNEENISTTLTEMYIDFLLILLDMKNQKLMNKMKENVQST